MATLLGTYIQTKMAFADEMLESGLQLGNLQHIKRAVATYQGLAKIVAHEEPWHTQVTEHLITACSAMCFYDPDHALIYLQEARKYSDTSPTLHNNFGYVYHVHTRDFGKSIASYNRCLELNPGYVMAHVGLIGVYRSLRLHDKELSAAKLAVENCPDAPEVHNCLGLALLSTRCYRDMKGILACFDRAHSLSEERSPTRIKALVNTGHVHGLLGDYGLAVTHYIRALECSDIVSDDNVGNKIPAYQNILLNLNYFAHSKSGVLRTLAERMGRPAPDRRMSVLARDLHGSIVAAMFDTKALRPPLPKRNDPTEKIRVGYICADFFDPNIITLTRALLTHRTVSGFDAYLYSNAIQKETLTASLPCAAYRCIASLATGKVADQIRSDDIDVLVDLSGHASGNRMDVIATRPAPILLTYAAHPRDVGLPFVRRVSDSYCEEYRGGMPDETVEMKDDAVPLIVMDRPHLTFTSPLSGEDIAKHVKSYHLFKPKSNVTTYGCYAKLQQINAQVIEVFKAILTRKPASRLVLASPFFVDPTVKDTWKRRFGVLSDRVLLTVVEATRMHMYSLIDVHLDTFPFCSVDTTMEALFMNVPVITLASNEPGSGPLQRASGSILHALRLQEPCIAGSIDKYVVKALSIPETLPHLNVRKMFLSGAPMDHNAFVRSFENMILDEYAACYARTQTRQQTRPQTAGDPDQ